MNLGTPKSPGVDDVRTYLREFLGDPDVISLPAPLRWLLLEGVILRTRPRKSAEAYKKIWTDRGSPLMFHTLDLAEQVRKRVAPSTEVAVAMRYGEPSIANVLKTLKDKNVDDVCLLPLYPQYARASTKTVVDKVRLEAKKLGYAPTLSIVPAFYDDDGYLEGYITAAREMLKSYQPDRVLLSFHGYPERYLKEDSQGHCLRSSDCCDVVVDANRDCYLRQCKVTARLNMQRLGLKPDSTVICFQSRLQDSWVKPFTDVVVVDAAKAGAKKLLVLSPAFVADCLETLEELELRAAEDFRAHGGQEVRLVPSLNASPAWADALVAIARKTSPHV